MNALGKNHLLHLLDAILLVLLAGYILGGTADVPFHGDESTTIWMSRDYAYLFQVGDLDRVRFNDPPVDAAEQQLRWITGSLAKYLIGLSWSFNGLAVEDLNNQWYWGLDWNWNLENGHIPDDELLMYGRWPSALMFALGLLPLFAIGRRLQGRTTAYLACVFYAMHPVLLLNGRRAMFEGGLILFVLLVVFSAMEYTKKADWKRSIALLLVTGLALGAKHTAIFTLIAVHAGLGVMVAYQHKGRFVNITGAFTRLLLIGVGGLSVFLLMHPILWGNPFTRAEQVYVERSAMLDGQVSAFGGYNGFADQMSGFWSQAIVARPQYYEVPEFGDYIRAQIEAYDSSIWRGISPGDLPAGPYVFALAVLVGFVMLCRRYREFQITLVLLAGGINLLAVLLLTPLEWQRYYLPAIPFLVLFAAYGISDILVKSGAARVWPVRKPLPQSEDGI